MKNIFQPDFIEGSESSGKGGENFPVQQPVGIVEIDQRLKNIEKIVDVVKHVSDRAVESWNKNLEQKTQQAEKEAALVDAQHRRSTMVLVYVISTILILCLVSLFKEQYELVKIIIGSSLALGAGAGMSAFFKTGRRDNS